jgi:hypothetical protein
MGTVARLPYSMILDVQDADRVLLLAQHKGQELAGQRGAALQATMALLP